MVVCTSPFTEGKPDQFQGSYGILPCSQMSVLDKELCHQGKVRGMLGVHCRTTPYIRTTDSSHVPIDLLSQE